LPNEIGADKIRHQPLAKASGMKSFRTLFRAKSMFEKSSFMRGKKQSISPFQDQTPKQQKT
jgi:hypothetical protein